MGSCVGITAAKIVYIDIKELACITTVKWAIALIYKYFS